ncbi:MAG: hypothetical protein EO766_13250 [Hydrotalea sp. AMD]|uniref:hypothetical protein n=1 Tax=Hydrotalea sp. AMD TaxID=2501297 RepID=UPI00102646D8|nr:hypothetical protein [Hydrotalea sp. AMD]RWZ86767.1 MAG: hypothetical protein EO766_13250 [Hydrotalea sp. AMD]
MISLIADEDTILQHIDEYTLYCHYLEYEPEINMNYTSPLREDDATPSFGLFPTKKFGREFFWKDSGGMGESGDVFKLIKLLYGYNNRHEVIARVLSDFGLGPATPPREKIVRTKPAFRADVDIRIKARAFNDTDLRWWKQFNVSEDILKQYRTSSLYCYWLNPKQRAPVFPSGLSFVYRIYDKYQLYFPLRDKGRKFRNDLQEHHVMGLQQLTFHSDTLIITKSYKDVMCLRSFGYDAVSPRSENVPMPEQFFSWADEHYKKKYVLFDNDMKHRGDWYPYPQIYVPIETGSKDISDFTRDHSPQAAAELLNTIVV